MRPAPESRVSDSRRRRRKSDALNNSPRPAGRSSVNSASNNPHALKGRRKPVTERDPGRRRSPLHAADRRIFARSELWDCRGRPRPAAADYLVSCAACRDTKRRGMVLTRRGGLDGRSVSALCLSGLVVQLPLLKQVAFSDCVRLRIGRARPRRRPDARGLHESVLLHNGSAVRPCRLPAK